MVITLGEVISTEMIKPSSPTPQHLKRLKLSYLDQLVNPIYIPLIFFYQANELTGLSTSNHVQISQHLKQSLSHTLTSFYPLAGRIHDNSTIDCNDAGVEFIDARVHAQLKDAIQDPTTQELKQYIPSTVGSGGSLLVAQITFFDCGGISIGTSFSHQIADFKSAMGFVNAWADTCRGELADQISPLITFDLANYFPSRDILNCPSSGFWEYSMSDENFTTKRFVFDEVKLAALRQAASDTSSSDSTTHVKNPTRVELVSAFIWKNFMDMAKSEIQTPGKKIFAAFHSVNLRARKSPNCQLFENVFGNCLMLALAFSDTSDQLEELHELVSKLRNSIRAIDDNYIKKSRCGYDYLNDTGKFFTMITKGEVEWCGFSSWCGFRVYEVDFGWENPVWFGTTFVPLKNLTVLMNGRCGEGIEAWVNMNQHNLQVLETQIKLI